MAFSSLSPRGHATLLKVGARLAETTVDSYRADGCGDGPTLAAALGALAGETALLHVARDLPESGWINNSAANALLYGIGAPGRPAVWSYIETSLINDYDVRPAALPRVQAVEARVAASVGAWPFPALNAPPGYEPGINPLEAGPRLRAQAHAAAQAGGLDRLELCYALAEAAILIIVSHREATPLPIAARLTLESMIAAVRVAPAPDRAASKRITEGAAPDSVGGVDFIQVAKAI